MPQTTGNEKEKKKKGEAASHTALTDAYISNALGLESNVA